jgi:hypothetical protein
MSSTSLDHSHFIKILQVKGSLVQPSEPTQAIDLSIYNKKGRQSLEVQDGLFPLKISKNLFVLTTRITTYAIKQGNVGH